MLVEYTGRRKVKGYIALFMYMSTKAIHLEVASELYTDVFTAYLARFISQRNYFKTINSDYRTNLVGANKKL